MPSQALEISHFFSPAGPCLENCLPAAPVPCPAFLASFTHQNTGPSFVLYPQVSAALALARPEYRVDQKKEVGQRFWFGRYVSCASLLIKKSLVYLYSPVWG